MLLINHLKSNRLFINTSILLFTAAVPTAVSRFQPISIPLSMANQKISLQKTCSYLYKGRTRMQCTGGARRFARLPVQFNSRIEQNAHQLGSDLGHNGWSQLRPIIEFYPVHSSRNQSTLLHDVEG